MEKYYFIQQNGVKKGAFKLNELKAENIYFDELVWRSDEAKWKKASEFEELAGIYLIKPPLTPLEIEKNNINKEFLKKVLPNTLGIYFILFLIISISSFLIANSSWEEVKKPYITNNNEVGKNSYDVRRNKVDMNNFLIDDAEKYLKKLKVELKNAEIDIDNKRNKKKSNKEILTAINKRDDIQYLINKTQFDLDYKIAVKSDLKDQQFYPTGSTPSVIKPIYKIPENIIALENINGLQQPFLFRPFYSYFSKIYLTREEQDSAGKLFVNIALSTFSLLLILLIINLTTIYLIKTSKANSSQ